MLVGYARVCRFSPQPHAPPGGGVLDVRDHRNLKPMHHQLGRQLQAGQLKPPGLSASGSGAPIGRPGTSTRIVRSFLIGPTPTSRQDPDASPAMQFHRRRQRLAASVRAADVRPETAVVDLQSLGRPLGILRPPLPRRRGRRSCAGAPDANFRSRHGSAANLRPAVW